MGSSCGFCPCLLALALATALAGCGSPSGPSRVPGGGSVELGNTPADDFLINFFPKSDNVAPPASTNIRNGKYRFSSNDGPMPGPYRVEIERVVVRGKKPVEDARAGASPNGPKADGPKSDGPKKWKFDFRVPDRGPFTKDFKLE